MEPETPYASATDLAEYAYCERAYYYRSIGAPVAAGSSGCSSSDWRPWREGRGGSSGSDGGGSGAPPAGRGRRAPARRRLGAGPAPSRPPLRRVCRKRCAGRQPHAAVRALEAGRPARPPAPAPRRPDHSDRTQEPGLPDRPAAAVAPGPGLDLLRAPRGVDRPVPALRGPPVRGRTGVGGAVGPGRAGRALAAPAGGRGPVRRAVAPVARPVLPMPLPSDLPGPLRPDRAPVAPVDVGPVRIADHPTPPQGRMALGKRADPVREFGLLPGGQERDPAQGEDPVRQLVARHELGVGNDRFVERPEARPARGKVRRPIGPPVGGRRPVPVGLEEPMEVADPGGAGVGAGPVPDEPDSAARPEDPPDLGERGAGPEPVERLGGDHRVGEAVRERDRLGGPGEDRDRRERPGELAAHARDRFDREDRAAEPHPGPGELPGPGPELDGRGAGADMERPAEPADRGGRIVGPTVLVAAGGPVEPPDRRMDPGAGGRHAGPQGPPLFPSTVSTGRKL